VVDDGPTRQPGLGTPRAWEEMGGGFDEKGKLKLGRLAPTRKLAAAELQL